MRPVDRQMLSTLASWPFIDRLEAVAVSGWSRGAVYGGFARLEESGLAVSIPHASELIPPTRRYRITGEGLWWLAGDESATPASSTERTMEALLRTRPVSVQWLRILVERVDALAIIYRLASTIAGIIHPVGLRLYRAGPLDAAMTAHGGLTVGVVRQGHTADRTALSRRLWKLGEGPLPGTVLILASDEVRLRHTRRKLPRSVSALLALERDAAVATPDDRVWCPAAFGSAVDLRSTLRQPASGGELPAEAPPSRADLPGDSLPNSDHALPFLLRPAEKRALDLIYDWPWMLRGELAGLLGVSEPRASQIVTPLEGFGLVTRPIEGSGRFALSDRGIALLARRDRASVPLARKRLSVSPVDDGAPCEWRNVSGGRTRQLLRNIEHTAAVHAFVASLARQARALGWEPVRISPPGESARHFRHEGGLRSVNPDAFGVLQRGPATWPFFLEWERRAVRPSTMAARLAPYLRYYRTHSPVDDHGARPAVLIVFDDELATAHFLRVAREQIDRAGVELPLWVAHRAAIDELGPLGRAWRTPFDPEPAQPLLKR